MNYYSMSFWERFEGVNNKFGLPKKKKFEKIKLECMLQTGLESLSIYPNIFKKKIGKKKKKKSVFTYQICIHKDGVNLSW